MDGINFRNIDSSKIDSQKMDSPKLNKSNSESTGNPGATALTVTTPTGLRSTTGYNKALTRLLNKLDQLNKNRLLSSLTESNLTVMLGKNAQGLLHRGSALFYFLPHMWGHLMDNDPDKVLSKRSIRIRSGLLHDIVLGLGRIYMGNKKIYVERKEPLPEGRPIIFAPNHSFLEDVMTTMLIADRHAYLMFGTLPHFFNTYHGIVAYLNGSILINRKDKDSRQATIDKAVKALELGTNIILYAEGTWNKTPNKLLLNYWPGIFNIAKKSNALIVPVVHLKVGNAIHSSRLAAFDIAPYGDNFHEALDTLRDITCTEMFDLMNKYSVGTRSDIIGNHRNMHEACEAIIAEQVRTAGRFYDYEVETGCATRYTEPEPFDVWRPIADLKPTPANAGNILYARRLLQENYQNRF